MMHLQIYNTYVGIDISIEKLKHTSRVGQVVVMALTCGVLRGPPRDAATLRGDNGHLHA